MSELSTLARWWAAARAAHKGKAPDPGLAYMRDLCADIAAKNNMEPFYGEIDATVAVVLSTLLMEADPLTRHTLNEAIEGAVAVYRNTESFASLNNLAVFAPMTLYASFSKPQHFINGLSLLPRFSRTFDWLEAPPELVTEAYAVLKLTASLDGTEAVIHNGSGGEPVSPGEERYLMLADEGLVELAATRHEQVNRIVDIVRGRPTISVDLVKDMLEFDQQTLVSGVL
jgi:hypothetical protein